ncbi:oxidoreductase [Gimesia aquarii]|uniref:NAD-reducing hydrogenase HoxS subunit delta n=1 Tax=Gimesia aquarii TaxID=2527964 RepID=A0A517WZR4_9PLAN|nr:oxidoreductase [Gimesia aquarii]QDU10742.1 NAD-reducing hydrogenase HoxS subunit delta [Gimesia aquarii]
MGKPKLGVFKFASCDGCQLSLLDAEDQLLAVAEAVDIVHFPEASSRLESGPYDIALIEGSITTPHDVERIQQIRGDSKFLMTIGACATAGGIQALRNGADTSEFMQAVYATPEYIQVLDQSTPIAEHVKVDFELRGCPINQYQLIEVIQSLLAGRTPRTPKHSVCLDCKRRGTVCVTVAQGIACLGPVTQSGCDAICPSYHRGCYGCYGPAAQPNLVSLSTQTLKTGVSPAEAAHRLQNFNVSAPAFHKESQRLTDQAREQN